MCIYIILYYIIYSYLTYHFTTQVLSPMIFQVVFREIHGLVGLVQDSKPKAQNPKPYMGVSEK